MRSSRRFPYYGWLGLALTAVFWVLNWSLDGLRTQWGFFPLWLGYILTVDALGFYRRGTSLLTRMKSSFIGLFLVSAPVWWIFELFNLRTQNWVYIGREFFSDFEYGILASISFSTVIPAVFVSADLASSFNWIGKIKPRKPRHISPRAIFTAGAVMMTALVIWPKWFYPFVWLSMVFLLEPLNAWLGYPTLSRYTTAGDWRPLIALGVSGLLCGFFWEMWNFLSYPKWIYHVPIFGFGHIFEMPILGYLGYIPFTLELWDVYHLVSGTIGKSRMPHFELRFDDRSYTISE
jgi:hypothetical protein